MYTAECSHDQQLQQPGGGIDIGKASGCFNLGRQQHTIWVFGWAGYRLCLIWFWLQCRRDRNVQPRQVVSSLFPWDLSKATAGCQRIRGMKSFHTKVTVCLADGEGAIRNAWARLLETCLDFNFSITRHVWPWCWQCRHQLLQRTSRLRIRARVASQRKGARGKADMPAIFANYRWLRCTKKWRKRCFKMQHHRSVQIQWHVMSDVTLIDLG